MMGRIIMKIGQYFLLCAILLGTLIGTCAAAPLSGATVLIIRHAEKPKSGMELTAEGTNRAVAYVQYFKNFQLDSKPLHLDSLFATTDSKGSHRPRLTLTPLSKALGLPLNTCFKEKDCEELASELQSVPHGKQILICWHHGAIPDLLRALGADPEKLLPDGEWPPSVFGWVIELRYDHDGKLIPAECKRINEHLMADDEAAAANP
jgi:hypothetical protein